MRDVKIDAKPRISMFVRDELVKRTMKSRNCLAINGIGATDENCTESADLMFNVSSFVRSWFLQVKQGSDICEA